ncbi:MAG: LuxR C-terminal-related transcriptional regulator [Micromonosporaceae bacterium]
MIRIVAAEDSYLIREGLRLLLAGEGDLDLVASVETLPDLLAAVGEHSPEVVLTDIRMPPGNRDEGIQAAEHLATSHPGLGVVVLSQYVEPEFALRLFDQGAGGRAYLLKERVGDLRQVRHAIQTVHGGGTVLDALVVDALVTARVRRANSTLSRLTARELEVLGLMATGLSNAAIATQLTLTERTVEKHIAAVLQKLDLDSTDAEVHRRVRAVLLYLSEADG